MVSALVTIDPGVPVPIPPLSAAQRTQAAAGAVAARRERAEVKRELKRGERTLRSVLADRDRSPAIARLRVLELVGSVPGVGPATAGRVLDELGIAASRRVRGLGVQQVRSLVERFEP